MAHHAFYFSRRYGFWQQQSVLGPNEAPHGLMRSVDKSLTRELNNLLPTLMNARDYRGAASILSLIYTHFLSDPAACVTTSLEILRRLPDTMPSLAEFYDTLLEWQSTDISKDVILRERFLLHLLDGNFHDAYAYYKEHMQLEILQQDIHVVAGFGMLCYWLLFHEDQDLRDKFLDGSAFASSSSSSFTSLLNAPFVVQHVVGTATLYQEALVSFRRAMTLCPESNIFVEYYVQILVMKDDLDLAADYLEHFYHVNPMEPHACRMLLQFLQHYFPESTPCHVEICIRWNELDPSASVPLQTLVTCLHQDLVAKETVVEALCRTLDHCGSPFCHRLHATTTEWAWETLADLLGPVGAPLPAEIVLCFEARRWWQRIYFVSLANITHVTALHVHKSIVAAHVLGHAAHRYLAHICAHVGTISESFDPDALRSLVTKYNLNVDQVDEPSRPSKRQKTTTAWSTAWSWRPSRGQLRMPRLMKRHQVLTSFDIHVATQVHEVGADAAPPSFRIPLPPVPVAARRSMSQQHPLQWLLATRGGRESPWHMETATVGTDAIRAATALAPDARNPVLTDTDSFALATEDELLIAPDATPLHLWTSYFYKNLPVPPRRDAQHLIKVMRGKNAFAPRRVPARFLWWIQEYMQATGDRAVPDECLAVLEAKWRTFGGRCRGMPPADVVTRVMEHFKRNPAIAPASIVAQFRAYVDRGKYFSMRALCHGFYARLRERRPSNLPFFSVVAALANQWLRDGLPLRLRDVSCFPPHVPTPCADLLEASSVDEATFLANDANRRYLSSIRTWLLEASPIADAALVALLRMHFDTSDPDFPSSPAVVLAMIEYVRVQLHAEFGDAPSHEDSIYYALPRPYATPVYRQYLEEAVLRQGEPGQTRAAAGFPEVSLVMLDKSQLPPSDEHVPSVHKLYKWWKEATDDHLVAGMGLGVVVPEKKPRKKASPIDGQAKTTTVVAIEPIVPENLPQMPELDPEMEIFPI
ncbi:Aste57867_22106 [Aphanomyces stellatus]|uniref:Aste57867_22106 protein n=1 Tax=Aphanomyces stellatus TaxID=120398 RepID=A0A485LJB3_9STRA|nr:hypothetical protein As57867_022037 [Aphanomyces stellatus]VFT98774.1 Aste57867_22106 [Aphanomyces stellatus]